MNLTAVLFAWIICVVSAKLPGGVNPRDDLPPPPTINQHFIDFIHNERVNFPCGWPDSDIGPIEPYRIDQLEVVIESSSEFSEVDFRMRDADVTGQKHLWINMFDLRLAGLFLSLELSIPLLNILGDHTTTTTMGILPVTGSGRVNMDCRNVLVRGNGQMTILQGGTLNLNFLNTQVSMQSVDATLTGFGALDSTISRLISAAAPGLVANNQELINAELSASLVPALNKFLNQHTMVTLVNLMADRNQNPPPQRCFW